VTLLFSILILVFALWLLAYRGACRSPYGLGAVLLPILGCVLVCVCVLQLLNLSLFR
jgi:hypothetical protein